jgi:hypothetical protein
MHGKRHGESKTTFANGRVEYRCYNMGRRIDCNKAAHINSVDITAFQVLSNKYPWYLNSLNTSGFDNEFVETFMDTIETLMGTYEFDETEFAKYYGMAIDTLEQTPYDSIINICSVLGFIQGLELTKYSELRMAVIDHSRLNDSSTYNIIKTTYPGYVLYQADTIPDDKYFETFCNELDNLMASYGELDLDDPFFIDSVDTRIYRAVSYINSTEETSSSAIVALKSAALSWKNGNFKSKQNKVNSILKQMLLDTSPKDVSTSVMLLLYVDYLQGNLLMQAVLDAYNINNVIISIPSVTTEISQNHQATSLTIDGYVHDDGRAEIMERGVVWGTIYNPTLENNTVLAGTGAGSFNALVSGLTEGVTYYTRAYATNSAGTAYGNCISFVARNTVGIEDKEINDFDFKIFPNPASDIATFSFHVESSENLLLTIVNIKGQIVIKKDLKKLSHGENQIQISISYLPNGIYNCVLTDNSGTKISRKFVIAH